MSWWTRLSELIKAPAARHALPEVENLIKVAFYPYSDQGSLSPLPTPAKKLNNLKTVQAKTTLLSDFS